MTRLISNNLALYNSNLVDVDYKAIFDLFMAFFKELGIEPNYIGLMGKGYPKQFVKFKTGLKKIGSKNFADLENINFIFNKPDSDAPSYDWLLSISLSNYSCLKFYLGFDVSMFNIDFEKAINKILENLPFEYGYSYKREFLKGPEFYCSGASSGAVSELEKSLINQWLKDSYSKRSYKDGKLRDLYLSNIINQKHLEYPINDRMKLVDFIKSKEPENESLLEISNGLFLWNIKPDNLLRYREELVNSDIFICYNKSVMPTIL